MRSIRPQTVTLAVLAILFGLGAAWAAKQVLLAKQPPVAVVRAPAEPKQALLFMQSNMVADARVRDQDVNLVLEPLEKLKGWNVPLEKAFKFKEKAVGRILKHAKLAGSWLTEDDFYPLGKEPRLKLKEGMRAVTLRIDDPAVSSDIIQTGCLVDVILTADSPDDSSKLTRRLASGLEVLSPPVSEGGAPNSVTSIPVTSTSSAKKSYIILAATPEQANQLALAQQIDGTISVSLCAVPNNGEGEQLDAPRVDALLSKGDYQLTERELLHLPPRPAPLAPPERIVVEQYRGDKIDYVVFNGDDERLSQEKAREDTLPRGVANANSTAAKPAKKCKNCIHRPGKADGQNSVPGTTPIPTPAVPRTT